MNLRGIRPDHTVPTPEYNWEEAKTHNSPSNTELAGEEHIDTSINVIKKFEINKDMIKQEFLAKENQDKRKWFFETFSQQELKNFRESYYKYLEEIQENIPYFNWFEENCLKTLSINVLKHAEKIWKTKSGERISEIPPLEEVRFPNIENKEVIASPFKMIGKRNLDENISVLDIQNVHSQLNYTNQLLHQVAIKNFEEKSEIKNVNPLGIKPLERSLITPTRFTDKEYKEFKLGSNTENLLTEINKKLEKLNIKNINILEIPQEEIGSINPEDLENDIFRIQRKFNQNPNTNNMPTTRNYYRRPTLPDIQFEEWNLESPSAFNGEGITEWNIDGLTEHQILRKTHEMSMAASAYRAKHNEAQTVKLLIVGFTGSLKGWWDNYLTILTQEQRNYILNIVKVEEGITIPLMLETLIISIIQSFMGDSNIFDNKTNTLLHNLRCPTLGDFRWYVDNFIMMVMTRADCKENFWKEKFITGLPPVFATKVREKLSQTYDENLQELTYGRIIAIIKTTALEICNNMKLEKQIKKQKDSGIKELGNFCAQYGYEGIIPP
uniref:Uncharacterized protein n=1 Tax=Cajanus cajan TaxID=3821 RepID=A0A151S9A7_CAJCA|nr:hypothetical protein KK1_026790 [Cajanus cajan]